MNQLTLPCTPNPVNIPSTATTSLLEIDVIISSEWHASPIFLFIISLSHTDTKQLHNSLSLLSSWNVIYMLMVLVLISWRKMEANISTQDHGRSLWMINFNFGSLHPPVNVRIYHCLPLDSTLRRPRSSVKECPCQNLSASVWRCSEKFTALTLQGIFVLFPSTPTDKCRCFHAPMLANSFI